MILITDLFSVFFSSSTLLVFVKKERRMIENRISTAIIRKGPEYSGKKKRSFDLFAISGPKNPEIIPAKSTKPTTLLERLLSTLSIAANRYCWTKALFDPIKKAARQKRKKLCCATA